MLQPHAVCSYLRGRLDLRSVSHLGSGRYRLVHRARGHETEPRTYEGDIVRICEAYNVDLIRIAEVCQ